MYRFRRRVPEQLVAIVGRAEFMETLNTTDIDVARTRAAYRNAEVEAIFEKARYERERQSGAVLVELSTPEEQEHIRTAVRSHVLEEDESVRLARPNDDAMDA